MAAQHMSGIGLWNHESLASSNRKLGTSVWVAATWTSRLSAANPGKALKLTLLPAGSINLRLGFSNWSLAAKARKLQPWM